MVSRDLSDVSQDRSFVYDARIAPVFDRLLAFFIDFLVFSPIVSLAGAFVLRDFRAMQMEGAASTELELVWLSLLAGSFALCVLIESLCVYRYGGTPGQLFMQLRVRTFPSRERMTLLQCLARTTLWWLSVPLVLPLLGLYTNRYRRAFHDRASETMVVTQKQAGDPGPLAMEVRFFTSWSQALVLFGLFVAAGTLIQVHHSLSDGSFHVASADVPATCESIDQSLTGLKRLDHAVAGFLAGQWDRSCLELEADLALWDGGTGEKPLANVAMGLALEDEDLSKAYLSRACEVDDASEACGIARYMKSEDADRGALLREHGLASLTSRLLLVRESVDRGEVASAATLIKGLKNVEMLTSWLQRQEVRAFWKLKNESRQPASDESKKLLEDFEERYDLR